MARASWGSPRGSSGGLAGLEVEAAGRAEASRRQKVEAAELALDLPFENRRLKEEVEGMRRASAFFAQGRRNRNAEPAFIAADVAEHAVRLMCRVLSVSRAGFTPGARPPPTGRRAGGEDTMSPDPHDP